MTGILTAIAVAQGLGCEIALLTAFDQWPREGWRSKAKAIGLVGLAGVLIAGGLLTGCSARLCL